MQWVLQVKQKLDDCGLSYINLAHTNCNNINRLNLLEQRLKDLKTKSTDITILRVIGRYEGLNTNQRICNLCNDNHLGDEYHIFFECKNVSIRILEKGICQSIIQTALLCLNTFLLLQSNELFVCGICKLGAFLNNVLPLFK